jgi:hypothetical protein
MPGMFLYNQQTYRKQTDYNTIRIFFGANKMKAPENDEKLEDNSYVIEAVMQEEFKFGVKANWEQILKVGGFSDTIEKVMLVTGNKVHNAGGITKQYYMGSEHIPISVKFRIFNEPADGSSPLTAVAVLTRACLPPNGASIETYIKELGDTVSKGVDLAKGLVEDLGSGKGFIKSLNNFFATLTGNVGNEVCYVTFGKWLSGFFVIKSVDFTYSKETSVDGSPYYIDFDVQFETLMIPTKGSVSPNVEVSEGRRTLFNLGQTKASRVSFEEQSEG